MIAAVGVTWFLYGRIPTAFIPSEDKGVIFANIELPADATQNRTEAVMETVLERLRTIPGVQTVMQNVGMSLTEVKKTIRSQVLMVFFLPLVAAGIHIAVSFRIIQMMVRMLAMGETKLFGMCTLITLGIFCVIYGLVYAFTAKSYYNIVRVKA